MFSKACVLPDLGYCVGSPWWTHLTYMFFHTNILHIAINLWAYSLFSKALMNIRWQQLIPFAYVISVAMSFLTNIYDKPTIGMSGVIYAMLGILVTASDYNIKLVKPLILVITANAIIFFFNTSNVILHMSCLVSGILITEINLTINKLWKSKRKNK